MYALYSDIGNEYLEEQEKKNLGNDVQMKSTLNLIALKPYDGGVEMRQTIKMDVKGMVPNFVSNYVMEHFSKVLVYVVDYYKDGKKPW